MALASKEAGRIHNKTGSDLTAMSTSYTNNKHLDLASFEGEAAMLHQMQLMQNDIDELRRYIISAELLVDAGGASLPGGTEAYVIDDMPLGPQGGSIESFNYDVNRTMSGGSKG